MKGVLQLLNDLYEQLMAKDAECRQLREILAKTETPPTPTPEEPV